MSTMATLVLCLVAGLGVFYIYTALSFGWVGGRLGPPALSRRRSTRVRAARWLVQAGLGDVRPAQFALTVASLFILGALAAFALFGGVLPSMVFGVFFSTLPAASYRLQRRRRLDRAQDAWPRMIEEIRIMTGSAGRSVPQALFEVGRRAPDDLRDAFDAAHREWLLTTDFEQTIEALKSRLADPTADVVCETLLVAHELGGTDLDQRLAALAEDRVTDAQGRKDAIARQAGARFARWFTVVVPFGMALVGMSIGDGRAAYQTGYGQGFVVVALLIMIACWVAAGQIMRLPEERRVFPDRRA